MFVVRFDKKGWHGGWTIRIPNHGVIDHHHAAVIACQQVKEDHRYYSYKRIKEKSKNNGTRSFSVVFCEKQICGRIDDINLIAHVTKEKK